MKRGKAEYWVDFRNKDTRTFRTGRKARAVYFSDDDSYCLVRFTGKKKMTDRGTVHIINLHIWKDDLT